MMKKFMITIDTEADNQWNLNQKCSTYNVRYLPRFQALCEQYGYKPVWLTTYEMAADDEYVSYMKKKQEQNLCEIGMHLHAWNNPPEYTLNKINNNREYLVEYPKEVMEEKIKYLTEFIEERFQKRPISHRSGRWTTNEDYFEILERYGYKVDCSVTPLVNWNNTKGATGYSGSNYSDYSPEPYFIIGELLEVPMSIRKIHVINIEDMKSLKSILRSFYYFIVGNIQWIRPDKTLNGKKIKHTIKKIENENNEYIMFMIHSSELMPNGSPNFKNDKEIDMLYHVIEEIFIEIKNNGYIGCTLEEFYNMQYGKFK